MRHERLFAPGLVAPRGYVDGMRVLPGHDLIFLAGHVAFDTERKIAFVNDLVSQVRQTIENLTATLSTAGGKPEDLVKLTVLTTDVHGWRAQRQPIGKVWRDTLGRVYPAMTLIPVAELFDEGALVEIEGFAAVPRDPPGR